MAQDKLNDMCARLVNTMNDAGFTRHEAISTLEGCSYFLIAEAEGIDAAEKYLTAVTEFIDNLGKREMN